MLNIVEKEIKLPSYKLASRLSKADDTVIKIKNTKIGGSHLTVIAGPCAVENEYQMLSTARAVKAAGATILRGGAYKPRTSPYSFQGLEEEGLRLLKMAGELTELPIVSEVISTETFDVVEQYVDILQIGARNMQNFPLLKRAGRSKKPILLKRGMSATIEELLMAAEYIMSEGNEQIILCERGIRTFETYTRNTLDLSAVLALKELTHLPVIVDPSHATGRHNMIEPLAKASVIVGAHGLMVEVHYQPELALCDGPQSLKPKAFEKMMQSIKQISSIEDISIKQLKQSKS
ncbi:3-deoxy-7-phosphoheptulonate synthase [Acidaminobacter sp. JC074]|uniref:3-deoxy-7-phosphoheptulonate synthase n=1 Tax=Acidaminobacter sp. JC074 TaxID=2530199 RepID=UPI001F0F06CA|nr:3-deoxy-7-phosphoheptulonate synthase [Acidaminobacter sp. JC074]MCH4889982.1 3-deoxy-7-phosphoheptulonate synthase [Acidaminobacter sp. JC074]